MADEQSWVATTHDWAVGTAHDHLEYVRANAHHFAAGGRRHLILEVLAYADDEAGHLGRRGRAMVGLAADGSVSVRDNGRGTDTRTTADGRLVRKPVMSTRDLRFFGVDPPTLLPDGLPRHGMSVVAALSPHLVHENRRGGRGWTQTYRYGIPDTELTRLTGCGPDGTTVMFAPPTADRSTPTSADLAGFTWLDVDVAGIDHDAQGSDVPQDSVP